MKEMMKRLAIVPVALALLAAPAAAQLADDAQFRRQQEKGRLEAERENTRIERERALVTRPPTAGSVRADPAANFDRMREDNRLRDDAARIERETDRLRAEQQRYERERLFPTPSP